MGLWAGIKYALNSSLGTSKFLPLDKLIAKNLSQSRVELFTIGWNKVKIPYGVTSMAVTACAGGGGGAGGYSTYAGGGGGGGGEWVENYIIQLSPEHWDTIIDVHVAGKSPGGAMSQDGGDGAPTIIGEFLTLEAGKGGKYGGFGGAAGGPSSGAGGGPGVNGGSSAKAEGGNRGCGSSLCGGGGGAGWSPGGAGAADSSTGKAEEATGFGGGGGGGSRNAYANIGGNGAQGFATIDFKW